MKILRNRVHLQPRDLILVLIAETLQIVDFLLERAVQVVRVDRPLLGAAREAPREPLDEVGRVERILLEVLDVRGEVLLLLVGRGHLA